MTREKMQLNTPKFMKKCKLTLLKMQMNTLNFFAMHIIIKTLISDHGAWQRAPSSFSAPSSTGLASHTRRHRRLRPPSKTERGNIRRRERRERMTHGTHTKNMEKYTLLKNDVKKEKKMKNALVYNNYILISIHVNSDVIINI
jgi:hypothetical protein